jgi:hypothetical protein
MSLLEIRIMRTGFTWPVEISRWGSARRVIGAASVLLLAACSPDKLLGNENLPPDVPDPADTQTPEGALSAYYGSLVQLRTALGGQSGTAAWSYVPISGLLTDELQSANAGLVGVTSADILVDSRFLPEVPLSDQSSTTDYASVYVYGPLQQVRGQARQSRGALVAYAPDVSTALAGHLYAAEGYAEILLADLFCSGIPLSTLDFGGDYTLKPGSTTEEVYRHAAALLDSALALSADSSRIMDLARVGKGRALLALGEYAAAAAAVADVPDDFQYAFAYSATTSSTGVSGQSISNRNFAWSAFGGAGAVDLTLVDAAGSNGLDYLSSGDPRTEWVANGTNERGLPLYRPGRYDASGESPIVLASGVEARLIEAEAQLHAGGADWLATLNALRTDGTFTTQPNAEDSTVTDTLWNAGSGGVAGLAPLGDPETPEGRVDLVFRERAFWLYLTGHRQGDLRRLIRQYGRDPETVYPTGPYSGGYGTYGSDVDAPVPVQERQTNPRYAGCISRGA